METFSELVDKLSIVNVKLYMVKEKQSKVRETADKAELYGLIKQDLALCKERSILKKEIDALLGEAIKTGKVTKLQEVKQY